MGGGAEVLDVDLVLAAGGEDVLAEGILADEAGREERERSARPGEVNQDVVGRAAGALGLAANVGELLRLRIDVDHLDLVDDPIAAGEQTAAAVCTLILHDGKALLCATSE